MGSEFWAFDLGCKRLFVDVLLSDDLLILGLFNGVWLANVFSVKRRQSIIDQANALWLDTLVLCVLTLLTSWFPGERLRLSAL